MKTPQVRQRAKDALLTYIQGDRFTSNEQLTYYAAFRRDIDVPKQQQARKANIRTAGLDGFAEHLGMLVPLLRRCPKGLRVTLFECQSSSGRSTATGKLASLSS